MLWIFWIASRCLMIVFHTENRKGGRLVSLLQRIWVELDFYACNKKGRMDYFPSSETVSFFLPRARRADNTLRPFTVDILSRNPCLFFLFLFDGWKVLFMVGRF